MAKQPYRMTKLSEIKPYERNPRIIPQAAVDAVAKSIQAFGFRQPIVVDGKGVILAGHTRYKAAQQLGLEEVPVVWQTDIDEIKARGYRIADNKTAEISTWDRDLFDEEIQGIMQNCDFDIKDLGLADWEMQRILDASTGITEKFEPVSFPGRPLPAASPSAICSSDEDAAAKRNAPLVNELRNLKYFSTRKGLIYTTDSRGPSDLGECVNKELYDAAMRDLAELELSAADREFFAEAAMRLIQFDFTKLAQYYAASSDPNIRAAMERLTLIIPDMDGVIANGLALLEDRLAELAQED